MLSTYPQISALARIAKAKQINRIRADLRTLKQGMRGSSALASSQMPKSQSRSKPARMFFARQWNLRLVWASRRHSPGPRWSHRKRGKADGWRSGDRRESLRKSADGTYVIKRHVLLLCYSLYLWIQPRGQRTDRQIGAFFSRKKSRQPQRLAASCRRVLHFTAILYVCSPAIVLGGFDRQLQLLPDRARDEAPDAVTLPAVRPGKPNCQTELD